MFVSSQNSHVEILIPNVMLLGGKAFGRGLGHKSRVLMNEISALKKRPHRALSPSPPCEDTMRKWLSATWKRALTRTRPFQCLDLELPASRTVRNKFLLSVSHQVHGICYSSPNGLRQYLSERFISVMYT